MTTNQKLDHMIFLITGVQEDVAGLKQDVSVLKDDVSVLKNDVSVLKNDVSELKQNVKTLTLNGEKMQSEIYSLKAGQAEIRDELKKLNTKVDETHALALDAWGISAENTAQLVHFHSKIKTEP